MEEADNNSIKQSFLHSQEEKKVNLFVELWMDWFMEEVGYACGLHQTQLNTLHELNKLIYSLFVGPLRQLAAPITKDNSIPIQFNFVDWMGWIEKKRRAHHLSTHFFFSSANQQTTQLFLHFNQRSWLNEVKRVVCFLLFIDLLVMAGGPALCRSRPPFRSSIKNSISPALPSFNTRREEER